MGPVAVYPIIVHKNEGSDYGISIPDVPGCVSAGASLTDAFEGIREALYCHAEGLLLVGESLPSPLMRRRSTSIVGSAPMSTSTWTRIQRRWSE